MKEILLNQSQVRFDAASHTYHLDGVGELKGITGTLVRRAFPDKYKDVDAEVLAQAAAKGTALHEAIQNFDRFGIDSGDDRLYMYRQKMQESGLSVMENEYLVSDMEHYATSIDIVAQDVRGDIVVIDTKTTYSLDRASTALQLTINKRFFEMQNPTRKVARIYALWLPNRDHTICQLVELAPWDDDTLDALIKADLNDEPFVWNAIPDEYYELETSYKHLMAMKEEAEKGIEQLKIRLMSLMQENKLMQIKSGNYTVSYIPEKQGQRFDSAAFKKENKDLYNQYLKNSVTAAQIRFTEVKK